MVHDAVLVDNSITKFFDLVVYASSVFITGSAVSNSKFIISRHPYEYK
jgi:hypothetical protein